MKVLTVCQPFAAMLLQPGVKPIENRSWTTDHRGPLLIHAGLSKTWMQPGDEETYQGLVFGAIVGEVTLVSCVAVTDLPLWLRDSPHAFGPWCWLVTRMRCCTPYKYSGARRLWTLPDEIYRKLEFVDTAVARV